MNKAPRQSFRARLARFIAGPVRARRQSRPSDITPPEDLLTSFETYALEHQECSKRLTAYCKNNPRIAAVTARYEAAWWSPDRTYLNSYIQDSEQDAPSGTRRELMRLMRWFEKNNPTLQKILDLLETNVVGTGLNPTPASADDAWNKAALKWWANWCDYADLGGRQHFYQLQSIMVRTLAVDGEIFVHLTNDPKTDSPRISLIEGHRVTSSQVLMDDRMKALHDADGILINKETGRPEYYVVTSAGAAEARIIPAKDIVHIYEPSRAGQFRGITMFHAITNTLHDLNDLQKFEMQAAKTAACTADIIYTATGEAPDSLIGDGMLESTTPVTADDKARYYTKQFGSSTRILQTGDKWEQAQSNRPSPAMRDFWQYLERKVCQGVGISAAAVLDYEGGWGGAALRGAVACDNRFYECRSSAITGAMQRIWEYALTWAMKTEKPDGLAGLPEGWNKPRWQPPRRSTVDIGRESAAVLNELKAGVRTYADIYGEAGSDWVAKLTQRANEAQFIYGLAKDRSIPPESIASLDSNERAAQIQAEAQASMRKDA